jgi:hypothetical protein
MIIDQYTRIKSPIGQEMLRDGSKKLAYSDIYSSISSKTINLIKIIVSIYTTEINLFQI